MFLFPLAKTADSMLMLVDAFGRVNSVSTADWDCRLKGAISGEGATSG